MVRTNIGRIMVTIKNYFVEHIKALDKVVKKLTESGLKVNKENSFFGRT